MNELSHVEARSVKGNGKPLSARRERLAPFPQLGSKAVGAGRIVARNPGDDLIEVGLCRLREPDLHRAWVSAAGRYFLKTRSNTTSTSSDCPARAASIPFWISASSLTQAASRSWTRRTPSRRTSLREP